MWYTFGTNELPRSIFNQISSRYQGYLSRDVFFGEQVIESLCQEALAQNQQIEFYYASESDRQMDKLSYRFIDSTFDKSTNL